MRVRAALVLALIFALSSARCEREPPMSRLMKAASERSRTSEARLAGFAWRPFDVAARQDLSIRATTLEVIATSADDYEVGVALLVAGDADRAVERLQVAADKRNDATTWNALAAAHLARATDHAPSPLADALADADRAIELCAKCPEPLFNRAVILERLGLLRHSAKAWKRYLAVDATSAWSDEARKRLHPLTRRSTAEEFNFQRPRLEAAATASQSAVVQSVVDRFPQQTRTFGEAEYLGLWGVSTIGGDSATARRTLDIARAIGTALSRRSGEELLLDAVHAIDIATPHDRLTLAAAHAAYREGRISFSRQLATESEPRFRASIVGFEAAESPMADVAGYYLANVLYDQNRMTEARALLAELLTRMSPRYRALRAGTLTELGVCAASVGDWNEAVRCYTEAISTYRSLGEAGNEAFAHADMSESLGFISQGERSWRHRIESFQLATTGGAPLHLRLSLGLTVQDLVRRRRWRAALSAVAIEYEEAVASRDDELLTDTLIRRALLEARLGMMRAATADVNLSRRAVRTISDSDRRRRLTAQASAVEATLVRQRDPRLAVDLLTKAIDFFHRSRRDYGAPELYFERGLAWRAVGDLDAAEHDLATALSALEEQREGLRDADFRSIMFDRGQQLLEEAVDLSLSRGHTERAFQTMERARARALIEELPRNRDAAEPVTLASLRRELSAGEALIEYQLIGDDLVAFVISAERVEVRRWHVDISQIRADLDVFYRAAANATPFFEVQRAAERLYDTIALPLPLSDCKKLTFIPDRLLQAVPYAALRDRRLGRYLVETSDISIAPSATIWSRRSNRLASMQSVLVIASHGTAGGRLQPLPAVDDEAQRISHIYGTSKIVTNATRRNVIEEIGRHSIIHISAHAMADLSDASKSAIVLDDNEGEATLLTAADIAKLRFRGTRLVILAACDTVRGETSHLEGMPSLARAFLVAGSDGVVASLWPIDDDVAKTFFTLFHASLAQQGSAVTALRAAQLAMLHDSRPLLRQPAVWGAIEIIGSAR